MADQIQETTRKKGEQLLIGALNASGGTEFQSGSGNSVGSTLEKVIFELCENQPRQYRSLLNHVAVVLRNQTAIGAFLLRQNDLLLSQTVSNEASWRVWIKSCFSGTKFDVEKVYDFKRKIENNASTPVYETSTLSRTDEDRLDVAAARPRLTPLPYLSPAPPFAVMTPVSSVPPATPVEPGKGRTEASAEENCIGREETCGGLKQLLSNDTSTNTPQVSAGTSAGAVADKSCGVSELSRTGLSCHRSIPWGPRLKLDSSASMELRPRDFQTSGEGSGARKLWRYAACSAADFSGTVDSMSVVSEGPGNSITSARRLIDDPIKGQQMYNLRFPVESDLQDGREWVRLLQEQDQQRIRARRFKKRQIGSVGHVKNALKALASMTSTRSMDESFTQRGYAASIDETTYATSQRGERFSTVDQEQSIHEPVVATASWKRPAFDEKEGPRQLVQSSEDRQMVGRRSIAGPELQHHHHNGGGITEVQTLERRSWRDKMGSNGGDGCEEAQNRFTTETRRRLSASPRLCADSTQGSHHSGLAPVTATNDIYASPRLVNLQGPGVQTEELTASNTTTYSLSEKFPVSAKIEPDRPQLLLQTVAQCGAQQQQMSRVRIPSGTRAVGEAGASTLSVNNRQGVAHTADNDVAYMASATEKASSAGVAPAGARVESAQEHQPVPESYNHGQHIDEMVSPQLLSSFRNIIATLVEKVEHRRDFTDAVITLQHQLSEAVTQSYEQHGTEMTESLTQVRETLKMKMIEFQERLERHCRPREPDTGITESLRQLLNPQLFEHHKGLLRSRTTCCLNQWRSKQFQAWREQLDSSLDRSRRFSSLLDSLNTGLHDLENEFDALAECTKTILAGLPSSSSSTPGYAYHKSLASTPSFSHTFYGGGPYSRAPGASPVNPRRYMGTLAKLSVASSFSLEPPPHGASESTKSSPPADGGPELGNNEPYQEEEAANGHGVPRSTLHPFIPRLNSYIVGGTARSLRKALWESHLKRRAELEKRVVSLLDAADPASPRLEYEGRSNFAYPLQQDISSGVNGGVASSGFGKSLIVNGTAFLAELQSRSGVEVGEQQDPDISEDEEDGVTIMKEKLQNGASTNPSGAIHPSSYKQLDTPADHPQVVYREELAYEVLEADTRVKSENLAPDYLTANYNRELKEKEEQKSGQQEHNDVQFVSRFPPHFSVGHASASPPLKEQKPLDTVTTAATAPPPRLFSRYSPAPTNQCQLQLHSELQFSDNQNISVSSTVAAEPLYADSGTSVNPILTSNNNSARTQLQNTVQTSGMLVQQPKHVHDLQPQQHHVAEVMTADELDRLFEAEVSDTGDETIAPSEQMGGTTITSTPYATVSPVPPAQCTESESGRVMSVPYAEVAVAACNGQASWNLTNDKRSEDTRKAQKPGLSSNSQCAQMEDAYNRNGPVAEVSESVMTTSFYLPVGGPAPLPQTGEQPSLQDPLPQASSQYQSQPCSNKGPQYDLHYNKLNDTTIKRESIVELSSSGGASGAGASVAVSFHPSQTADSQSTANIGGSCTVPPEEAVLLHDGVVQQYREGQPTTPIEAEADVWPRFEPGDQKDPSSTSRIVPTAPPRGHYEAGAASEALSSSGPSINEARHYGAVSGPRPFPETSADPRRSDVPNSSSPTGPRCVADLFGGGSDEDEFDSLFGPNN